jgi:hypothetical protein
VIALIAAYVQDRRLEAQAQAFDLLASALEALIPAAKLRLTSDRNMHLTEYSIEAIFAYDLGR